MAVGKGGGKGGVLRLFVVVMAAAKLKGVVVMVMSLKAVPSTAVKEEMTAMVVVVKSVSNDASRGQDMGGHYGFV